MKKQILATLFLLTLLASCTVQKRYFNSGYNINWHITGKNQGKETPLNKKEKVQKLEQLSSDLISMENSVIIEEEIIPFGYITNEYSFPDFHTSSFHIHNSKLKPVIKETKTANKITEIQQVETKKTTRRESKSTNDSYLYLLFVAMAAGSIGVISGFRKKLSRVTRWAKANPKKTQIALTGMQLSIAGLGLISGYNLSKMGFNFSDNISYTMSAIGLAGFLATPFLPKKNSWNIPKKIFRNKVGYMSIALSAFMIFNITGNRMAQSKSNSLIPKTVENLDTFMFGEENSTNEIKSNSKRLILEAGVTGLTVFLVILLSYLICGGLCLTFYGVISFLLGEFAFLLVALLGITITIFSIVGIKQILNRAYRAGKNSPD